MLSALRERLEGIGPGSARAGCAAVPTGWREIDGVLPGSGLSRGALHEWFDRSADPPSSPRDWTPPLLLLAHLALRAAPSWTVWIGRRVWPFAHTLGMARRDGASLLDRSLLIDAPDRTRVWAIDAALRCPAMVVIADGSGLDIADTRRLQLASEAGGTLALLARPHRELTDLSVAATRWEVSRAPPSAGGEGGASQRWRVRLLRCKRGGMRGEAIRSRTATEGREWTVERTHDRGLVALYADVRVRPDAASSAS